MDLAINDERISNHSASVAQTENEHRHPDKTAVQDVREVDLPMTYSELLQQYSILSSQNAKLAKAYLKLEHEHIMLFSQNAELAKEYLRLEQECAGLTVSRRREQELEQQLAHVQAILSGVLASLSWRITAPIRKLMEWIRRRK